METLLISGDSNRGAKSQRWDRPPPPLERGADAGAEREPELEPPERAAGALRAAGAGDEARAAGRDAAAGAGVELGRLTCGACPPERDGVGTDARVAGVLLDPRADGVRMTVVCPRPCEGCAEAPDRPPADAPRPPGSVMLPRPPLAKGTLPRPAFAGAAPPRPAAVITLAPRMLVPARVEARDAGNVPAAIAAARCDFTSALAFAVVLFFENICARLSAAWRLLGTAESGMPASFGDGPTGLRRLPAAAALIAPAPAGFEALAEPGALGSAAVALGLAGL